MGICTEQKALEEMDARERCLYIDNLTPEGGLYTDVQRAVHPKSNSTWRVSPEPFWMPPKIIEHSRIWATISFRFTRLRIYCIRKVFAGSSLPG